MKSPRPYQREAIDSLYQYWESRSGNPLIVAPCGAGKSLIIAFFIKEARAWPDTRILVLSHRKELLQQNEAELRSIYPDAPTGFYSSGIGRKDRSAPILFAGIQTIANHIHKLDPFELVLIDECHLIPRKTSTQYGHTIATLKQMNPDTRFVGYTATPYRLDSGQLHEGDDALFDAITYEIPVIDLIRQGHLCEVVGKRGAEVADLTGVRKRAGEFVASQAEAAFDVPALTAAACDEIVAYGQDRKAWLIFASGVDHAEHVRDALRARGIDCEAISGKTPKDERERVLAAFKAGRLRCLVNCDILTIGFNAPICDMGVLLRATASTALYVQIVGRLMRTYPGKENALLLDYGGNVERHGPIDAVRPKRPGKGGGEAPAKACPSCHSIVAASARACPDCGHQFPERSPRHEKTAYGGAVMSHQSAGEWIDVDSVSYHRHRKAGKPDSVRVEYQCGLKVYKDWLTPGHEGYPRSKTIKKLFQAGVNCPDDADGLLAIADQIPKPTRIYVKPDGKYERVEKADYRLEETLQPENRATA